MGVSHMTPAYLAVPQASPLFISSLPPPRIPEQVYLSADLSCGVTSPRPLTNDLFDFPTTAARKNNALYIVNAKFSVAEQDVPTTEYEILRVDRDGSAYNCSSV